MFCDFWSAFPSAESFLCSMKLKPQLWTNCSQCKNEGRKKRQRIKELRHQWVQLCAPFTPEVGILGMMWHPIVTYTVFLKVLCLAGVSSDFWVQLEHTVIHEDVGFWIHPPDYYWELFPKLGAHFSPNSCIKNNQNKYHPHAHFRILTQEGKRAWMASHHTMRSESWTLLLCVISSR